MASVLVVFSCQKDDNYFSQTCQGHFTEIKSNSKPIALGEQIQDPYMFENMEDAFDEFVALTDLNHDSSISPTGYYVRVLPTTINDFDIIEKDSTIAWFNFPLDYEILNGGDYYQDASLPDTSYTWKYAVLPIGHPLFTTIAIDTIYPVFIPEDCPEFENYPEFFDKLEDYAIERLNENSSKSRAVKWNPSAQIKVQDRYSEGTAPMDGLRIKVKQSKGCKSEIIVTNESGYASTTKKFKNAVRYSIDWGRHHWKLFMTDGREIESVGNESTSQLNYTITSGAHLSYATVHQAAIVAFYKPEWTIHRPYYPTLFGNRKVKIKCTQNIDELVGVSRLSADNSWSDKCDIIINGGGISDPNNGPSLERIFAVTLHELAHVSHFRYCNNIWGETLKFVKESWAVAVEWAIMNRLYGSHFGNLGYNNGYQGWNWMLYSDYRKNYTPLFIDLMDNYNQSLGNSTCCNDAISGFSLEYIENHIIPYATNVNTTKTAILNCGRVSASLVNDLLSEYLFTY